MIDEREEFRAYTEAPVYSSTGKRDLSYMGRFTFDMLMDFEGLARVLTIVARGYMWQQADEPDVARARRALLAWCSVPDSKKASPKEGWQYQSAFPELCEEFPALVDSCGGGWLYRHVHHICDYVKKHPDIVSKTAQEHCIKLARGFDAAWRNKVLQFQTPIFSPSTRGAWVLRFDDVLADAKELGPLRENAVQLDADTVQRLKSLTPEDVPWEVVDLLARYYLVNRPMDSQWAVLPVTNVDAWFGNTNFSRKWLVRIPDTILIREKQSFGVCRYKMAVQGPSLCEN